MLRTPVSLSDIAFDVLWKQENLGEYHAALHVDSPGATDDERAVIERDAIGVLRRDGLDHPDVRDALHLLARADREFSAWIAVTPHETRPALVAADARNGVLALRDNGFVRLRPVRPDTAAETLTAQLPDVPAGRGSSINVHESELDGHGTRALSAAQTLRQLMKRPRTGSAKLYAAHRGRDGRRRATTFLTTVDFPDGRWLVVKYTDSGGHAWVHATPATRRLVADWLYRLNVS